MDMDGMDCCAKAMAANQSPEVQAAKVCCAVNCPQSGATEITSSVQKTQPLPTVTLDALEPKQAFANLFPRYSQAQPRSKHSQPTYIQHSALLI